MATKAVKIFAGAVALIAAAGIGAAVAMSHMSHQDGDYAAMHAAHHGGEGNGQGMMHGGPNHTEHDEINMPGLRGLNATPEESAEIAVVSDGVG